MVLRYLSLRSTSFDADCPCWRHGWPGSWRGSPKWWSAKKITGFLHRKYRNHVWLSYARCVHNWSYRLVVNIVIMFRWNRDSVWSSFRKEYYACNIFAKKSMVSGEAMWMWSFILVVSNEFVLTVVSFANSIHIIQQGWYFGFIGGRALLQSLRFPPPTSHPGLLCANASRHLPPTRGLAPTHGAVYHAETLRRRCSGEDQFPARSAEALKRRTTRCSGERWCDSRRWSPVAGDPVSNSTWEAN